MDFIDDPTTGQPMQIPRPAAGSMASIVAMGPMPSPPALVPREEDRYYNSCPTPEAKQEAAIKRFLTNLSSLGR